MRRYYNNELDLAFRADCNRVVNWTRFVALLISILAVPLATAQGASSKESTSTMSEREQHGLRGAVKSCVQEITSSGVTDAEGQTYPQVRSTYATEYDRGGRTVATRSSNSDGSQWVTRYSYDPSGRLLKTAAGDEGQATTETIYSYDHGGRLQNISGGDRPDSPVTFSYDERGRKTKIEISRPAFYRPSRRRRSRALVRGGRRGAEPAGWRKRNHSLRRTGSSHGSPRARCQR